MRWLIGLGILAAFGCGDSTSDLFQQYDGDSSFRRSALESSLVEPSNGYSQRRLNNYGLSDGWDSLKLWNPPTRPVTVRDLDRFSSNVRRPSTADEGTLSALQDTLPDTMEGLVELGRQAFERYPLQVDNDMAIALESEEARLRYGLWRDERDHLGGFVRVSLPGDAEGFATTCATCHARTNSAGVLVHGAANTGFNRGQVAIDLIEQSGIPAPDSFYSWGPGRLDVTANDGNNPVAISDLRPIRHQSHLQFTGSVRNGIVELAIRIETLMITSVNEQLRPPRIIPFAIATYLWTLSKASSSPPLDAQAQRGQVLFSSTCSTCHREDGSTAEPVDVALVGTNADLQSSNRATDHYRVPSLFLVFDRPKLLHDASVSSLPDLLDPERQTSNPGHAFGSDLSAAERSDLIAFVRTLGR